VEAINPNKGVDGRSRPAFAALRRYLRPRRVQECCELCGLVLGPEHPHLLETGRRQLLCACDACALLFSHRADGKYRRLPRRSQFLPNFRLSDVQWAGLQIPIDLAFFFQSTPAGRVLALYPSPAGTIESVLPLEAWDELARENPVLRDLEPDVEALLVNRVGPARDYYRVSIDECYKLVGLLRTHWRGISGGSEVWGEIERFFADLKKRSSQ
jgi:hypothetical protein